MTLQSIKADNQDVNVAIRPTQNMDKNDSVLSSFMAPWYQTVPMPDTLKTLLQQIESDLHQEIDIEYLAQRHQLDQGDITELFQQHLSLTPIEYQKKIRLNKAQYLLEETLFSLEKVANQAGFGNITALQDAFLQNLEMFPSRYR